MDIKEVIKNRRSIRKYLKEDIPYEDIIEIISYGILAPNAGNIPHYYFIIIKDPEKIEKISNLSNQEFIKDANTLVVIVSDDKKLEALYGKKGKFYAIQDIAAIVENILLAATDKNIGTCWIGSFDEEKLKELLGIPKDRSIHVLITMGYPDEKPNQPIKPNLNDIIFFEKWGNKLYKPQFYPLMQNIRNIINYLRKSFEKL
ncbi:MAG: nitroreductase family protein [Nanopusillaceae archaeon]|jgi:nitroreductase